jgi:hypothetical protein
MTKPELIRSIIDLTTRPENFDTLNDKSVGYLEKLLKILKAL